MSKKPNILIRFWQELKRRKVFKVLAMYAGSAFVVIQVIDILTNRLNLPPWIATLVIIILSVGFPVTAVLSWIFDLTPEGIKKTESLEELVGKEIVTTPVRRRLKVSDIIIFILVIAVIILAWPKIFKPDTIGRLRSKGERIAVAVMPFQNMTNDSTWNIWQKGIQDMLITYLSGFPDVLKVRETEYINTLIQSNDITSYATFTPSLARTISKKLEANVFISGTIRQAGKRLLLSAKLVDTRTNEVLKPFEVNGMNNEDSIMNITRSLRKKITDFLVISKMEKESSPDVKPATNSPEAYKYFLEAGNAWSRYDFETSRDLYYEAVKIDSNFVPAIIFLSMRYNDLGLYEDGKKWCLRAYEKRDQVPIQLRFMAEWYHALIFGTPDKCVSFLKQYQEYDDQVPVSYWQTSYAYGQMNQYSNAITEYEKALELYRKWKIKPMASFNYTSLGYAYHQTGQYKKEKRIYKNAERDFPDDYGLLYRQAVLALSEGKTKDVNEYIEKFKSILKNNSASEAAITTNLAGIYSEAGVLDKAEEYYRQALSFEPDNPDFLSDLAWFLIDKDRNINEGMRLNDKALELSPDRYYLLDTKGWGLYKQGKYKEALDILQKSWDLRMKNAFYDHLSYLHLEAAKKAVAGQK